MRKLMLLLMCLVAGIGSAMAQYSKVTGQVLSAEDNEPLVGATIRVTGSSLAVSTDADGKFVLNGITPESRKIEVTYVGYAPQTVDIQPEMKIYLSMRSEMMDEVIVVAFGKQKREAFTGSATVVGAAEIQKMQVTNPLEALNGRVSGMTMTETDGLDAGAEPEIVIRGIGSLNAGTAPLIVLDGLPFSGYLSDINPDDVENITVLKDASSNALYGARGANGVIMITTKNAERGNTKVTLSAKWGVNHDARVKYKTIDEPGAYYEAYYRAYMNGFMYDKGMTFAQAHAEANRTIGLPSSQGGLAYMIYTVPENQFLIGENGKLNPNAVLGNRVAYKNKVYTLLPDDWTKEGTRNGLRQEYNLNISGGTDKYSYVASLGHVNNEGIAYGSEIKRTTARLKTTFTPYSFLRIGANAGFTNTESSNCQEVFNVQYTIAPIFPLYLRDGDGKILYDRNGPRYDYGNDLGFTRPIENGGNPIQNDRLDKSLNSVNAFSIQGYATLDFAKYFHLTVNGSVYITENRLKNAYNPYYGFIASGNQGYTWVGHYRTGTNNYQQILNYNRSWNLHNVELMLGHEYTRNFGTGLAGDRTRIANYRANTELNGAVITSTNSSYRSLYNVEGYFFRGQYDYDNRFFANGSYRRDGSSRFHPDHRWGNFWSIGGAWMINKESWFPSNTFMNTLKVKVSYGEQGNDQLSSDFMYTDMYDIKNSNGQVSFVFDSKGNPDITWEKVGNFNTGIEFSMFNSRLNGGIEFYRRKTSDMLMYLSAPYEMGYSGYYDNVGDMVNRGIEIDMNADIIATRNFKWNFGFNFTWEKNRVTYIPDEKAGTTIDGHKGYIDGSNYVGEGLPVYTWYIKKYAGVGENGEALYYTTQEDGSLTTTTSISEANYYLAGSALPKVYGGFTTSFKVFDFDLSAQFNYSIGGKKADYGYQALMTAPYTSFTGTPLHRDVLSSWTPDNPGSEMSMWYFGDETSCPFTDRWLIDASYLSLRNITLGYTLPKKIAGRLRLRNLRVYAACENVAYWTKRAGFDPRMNATSSNYGSYSPTRTITGGIQVEF